MSKRGAVLIATFVLVLVPAAAGASRKLSITQLQTPPGAEAGDRVPVSGTLRNTGSEKARATVRAYVQDTVGQMRIGGTRVPVGAGKQSAFSFSPKLPSGTPDGDYTLRVCARRLNKRGAPHCLDRPFAVTG